ncbi:MAG: T9SS type A sorting domain-containing protein [Chitinophagales bacterium]|jgi:hypothetical protein|nr:T9SS type A sorting domain-containing protein [Chitinophagales bacterium]
MKSKRKLFLYSSMATAYIASGSEVGAQAVYVDIEPDTVLSLPPNEAYILELNEEGLIDFAFQKFVNYSAYADWCECYQYISEIALSGTESIVVFTSYQFTSDQYLVSAILPGVMINGSLNFKDIGAKMAYRIIPDWSIYYVFDGGDWFPEAIDKYVGIRFEDSLDCMHYGWIRCSVEDGGSKLTIKDYAFETKCDVAIVAGDTIGDTTSIGISEINKLDAFVYSFGKEIFIHNNTGENISIIIYDISGRQITTTETTDNLVIIPMQKEVSGIYLVQLQNGEKKYIRKVEI